MASETTEAKACKALVKAVSDVTFNPAHFAQVLVNQPPIVQKRVAELFWALAWTSAHHLDYDSVSEESYPYMDWYNKVREIPLTGPVL